MVFFNYITKREKNNIISDFRENFNCEGLKKGLFLRFVAHFSG